VCVGSSSLSSKSVENFMYEENEKNRKKGALFVLDLFFVLK
jgi:hypothetical protein